eukprot:1625081-Prymnesium_polylepis.1
MSAARQQQLRCWASRGGRVGGRCERPPAGSLHAKQEACGGGRALVLHTEATLGWCTRTRPGRLGHTKLAHWRRDLP